jgi:glutamyl-tRNA synthetase
MAYKEMGYLPEALVNYLVRLGWSHGDQEIFSVAELIDVFSLEAVGKSPAVFNPEKLLWLNQHYIKEYSLERLTDLMIPFWQEMGPHIHNRPFVTSIISNLKARAKTLNEMADAGRFYFHDEVVYEEEAARNYLTPEVADYLETIAGKLSSLQDYSRNGIEAFLRGIADEAGIKLKVIAQPLRVALTGKSVSPGIDEVMITLAMLGRDCVISRIRRAVAYIKAMEHT